MSTVTKASVYSRSAEDTPDTPSLASIDRFLDAVWMERGLSPNTLSAYRADLTALDRWLQSRGGSSLTAKRADVLAFIAYRVEAGARPRSTARQLSSFRRYYRYLIREGAIKEDPTAQIAMPKIGRSLPKSLSEEEVEALLAAPEIDDPLGNRDRSMLEVLYATGLRVSELVNLKSSQVNMNQGVLRIVGKGDRERLIPLGEEAVSWLQKFMNGPRLEILLERQTEYLFPTRRGDDAPGVLAHHQALRAEGGCCEGAFAPHAAPCIRHAPAEPRRRFARGADVVGS
jgi:integrase/recombinase XerD